MKAFKLLFRGWYELGARPEGTLPGLDFLRSLAILLVFSAHFTGDLGDLTGAHPLWTRFPLFYFGWTGVDLFFVLSGFLIGRQLWRELQKTGKLKIGKFLLRRGLRIWPLYYFILAFLVLVSQRNHGESVFLRDIFFLTNYLPGVVSGGWSLSTEEQFYIVTPFLLWGVSLLFHKASRWSLVVPGGLLILMPLVRKLVGLHGSLLYTPIHTHCDGLLMGLLFAGASVKLPELFKIRAFRQNWPVPALMIALGIGLRSLDKDLFAYSALAFIFGGMTLFLLRDGSSFQKFVGWQGFHVVSKLSYGMYLNHFELLPRILKPLLPAARTAFGEGLPMVTLIYLSTLFASLLVAGITFSLIELPVLEFRDKRLRASRKT